MATKLSGNLAEDARLMVFDETTGILEYNQLTSSGTYEIKGLSDDPQKTLIARASSGEAHGYGDLTAESYFDGYTAPYTDNFEDNGSPLYDGNWWMTRIDTDSWADWWDSNTTFRLSCNEGITSEGDSVDVRWFYNIDIGSDFDIWVDTSRISMGSLGSGRVAQVALFITNGQGAKSTLGVRWRSDQSTYYHSFWENGIGTTAYNNISSSSFYDTNVRKLRVRRSGDDLITYIDRGSGWELGHNFSGYGTKWSAGTLGTPQFYVYRYGTTSYQSRFDDFHVEEGTIVSPVSMELFKDWPAGYEFNEGDQLNEWTLTSLSAGNTAKIDDAGSMFNVDVADGSNGYTFLNLNDKLDTTKDFIVSFRVKNISKSNGDDAYTTVRLYTGNQESGFRFGPLSTVNQHRIERVSNSSWTNVYTHSSTYDPSTGNILHMLYFANSGLWRFYIDGIKVYEETLALSGDLTVGYVVSTWGDYPQYSIDLPFIKVQGTRVA